MRETMKCVSQYQASQLLHNKFVVVLGDSIQRSVYKDIVVLLQKDRYLTLSQLKSKGEMSFEEDHLVEGGCMGHMNNGTEYREVRQFRSDHHLVRFYFLTRIYSRYMQSILDDLQHGLKPDIIIVNSCVWDISRYNPNWASDYKENLHKFFEKLNSILPHECLLMWNMTMPLGKRIIGGFLVPEIEHMGPTLRNDVIEANFYGSTLAGAYGMDVLDLHFHFRFSLQHRMKDGVHWNALAHRRITSLLLQHAAQAWGVVLPCPLTTVEHIDQTEQQHVYGSFAKNAAAPAPSSSQPYRPPEAEYSGYGEQFYQDILPSCPMFGAGYFSFEAPAPGRQTELVHRETLDHHWPVRNNRTFRPALPAYHMRPYDSAAHPTSVWTENPYVMRKRHNKQHDAPPYTRHASSLRPHCYHPPYRY